MRFTHINWSIWRKVAIVSSSQNFLFYIVTWWSNYRWVWIGNWVYWTLTLVTTNNSDSLTELHIPKITVTIAHKVFSVLTSHCLVAACNGERSPSSGFLNCFWPQLPASSHNCNSYFLLSTSQHVIDLYFTSAAVVVKIVQSWHKISRSYSAQL
jgi:hypothetical protein